MKNTVLTLLTLAVAILCYAQSTAPVDSLKTKVITSAEEPTVNPVETVSKADYDALQRKLDYSEFIISSLNTTLTIIAVLFGLLLPFLSYFFVIRPQNELKKTLTKNIKTFLTKRRTKVLKDAFKVLNDRSSSEMERRLALDDLEGALTIPSKRSELLKVINVLEHETYPNLRQDLHFILVEKKHAVVESFYAKQWEAQTVSSGEHFANVYFCNYPEHAINRLIPVIRRGLQVTQKFFNLYNLAVEERNMNLIRQLVDNGEIAEAVRVGVLPDIASAHSTVFYSKLKQLGFPEAEIKEFALLKMFMEVGMLSTQHRGVHSPQDLRFPS